MEKRFLSIREAAEYLNVSVHYLYRQVGMKRIPHCRMGKKILFDIQRLEKFIDESSIEPQDWTKFIS